MDEIRDLEEAKLMIDMRNDEISSLQNSMKMVEIKANKNIAEANYKLTSEKNRADTLKKETDRLKDELAKVKASLAKAEQSLKANEAKHQSEIKDFTEKLRLEREHTRAASSQLRQGQVAVQQLEAEVQNIKKQLRPMRRIVNVSRIFELTGKSSLDEIPPYIDLLGLLKDKADQITELRDKLEQVTKEALGMVSEKEKKMLTYEQQLQRLNQEKQKLDSQLQAKSQAILSKEEELEIHKQMLDETQHKHESTYEELTAELSSLRTSVTYYERESIRQSVRKDSGSAEENLRIMHELTSEFEAKEEGYQRQIEQLEKQLADSQNSQRTVEKELNDEVLMLRRDLDELQATVDMLSDERRSNLVMIDTLQRQTLEFEAHYERIKLEGERFRKESEESSRARNELQNKLSTLTEDWQERERQLLYEIDRLREESKEISEDIEERNQNFHRLSLDIARKPSADFEDLYKVGLRNHNHFLLEVYNLLTN